MKKVIFITGGARSGKSRYGLKRAEEMNCSKCFVATCPPLDEEMKKRISNHLTERQGKGWDTIEEQIDIANVIKSSKYSLYVIDCLTLWINNLIYRAESSNKVFGEKEIIVQCDQLIQAVRESKANLIFITNEVGMSVVPENPLARNFRDLVGRCNQMLAAVADEVIFVSCGIPMQLK